MEALSAWLPALFAGLQPILFLPVAVDGFILPRAALTLLGGAAVFAAGLLCGRRRLGRLGLPSAAVAAAAVLAALVSVAPNLSLVGSYGRYESLPVRLAYLGLLVGAAWLGERRRLVTAFLAGCGLGSAEAVAQALMGALPRPDGNLGQPNLLGGLLAVGLPLAVGRALGDVEGRGWRWLGLAALLGAGLAVSASRSGWLAALVGTSVLVLLLVPRVFRLPALAGAAVLAGVAVALLVFSPLRHLNQDTGSARAGVWRDSLQLVAARPVFGWGEDTFGLVYGRYQSADWEPGDTFDRAHSLPLDLAAAQGAAGLGACAWLFATWWLAVLRRPPLAGFAGAAAAYLLWALLNFDWAPVTAPFWLLAGAAWPGAEAPQHRPGAWRWTLAGTALGTSVVFAAAPLAADLYFFNGRPAAAAAIDPLQPRYRGTSGTIGDLQSAAALHDLRPETYVALGDAEARAGETAAARSAYQEALALYPYDQGARKRLALTEPPP